MITVLADDITGAAEIAGICLRFGLNVTFDFAYKIESVPTADVWIIAFDTRSLPENEACETVQKIVRFLKEQNIRCIYKKIDSALRGHILPEITVLLDTIPYKQTLVLPANPEMGRIIRDGIYYINQIPLNETAFANDPDFPAKSASVKEILNTAMTVNYIPDCIQKEDFRQYAQSIDPETLPVGGAAFFEVYLQICFPATTLSTPCANTITNGAAVLMICGSTYETSKRFIRNTQVFDVVEIPQNLVIQLLNPAILNSWMHDIKDIYERRKRLIITMKEEQPFASPENVKRLLAEILRKFLETYPVEEIFIEGGATAYACLEACNISSLIPFEEYARGVVRLKIPDRENIFITIKPGSYEWPEKLLKS
ncbi:MAG: four-carbon acid sugar kinase family protein [Dysgonamonadaceae bacterium]|jgi:uncharacterized protein YgbK (DUF1537 family)|nr:four-carbon acid sugar kinase family protein [Dysgonamonadaceae bacterium]